MSEAFSIPSLEIGAYEHHKGNKYQVLGVGCHTETHECFVVYKPLHDQDNLPNLWIRPYDMFIENVEIDGVILPRFKKIEVTT